MTLREWLNEHPFRLLGWILMAVFLLLVGTLAYTSARAEQAVVSWTAPTQRVDETPLPPEEIAGYDIEWGRCGDTPTVLDAGNVSSVTIPLPDPAYGEWCFRARTRDTGGLLSDWVGPATKVINAPPKPPTLTTIETIAYEARIHPTQGLIAGRTVGWVPLGTACHGDANGLPFVGPDLYAVDPDTVAYSKQPKTELILARCAGG